ncbi:GntR family transcriptional regulator [Jatrophihabitans sp. DSM 45814]
MTIDATERSRPHLEELAARLTVGYKTIGEMVYEVIREAIVAGVFAPGERLRQEALATAIGVSRIPVRSALLQLEAEGLVNFHPRRGAVVRSLSIEQLREIYELREVLEPHALRKSMKSMTVDRIERLREFAAKLDKEHEGSEFLEMRIEFYRELYDNENNPQLVKIIEDLRGSVGRYLLGWRIAQTHDHSHAELVDEVANGDVKAATKLLLAHLEQVRQGLEEMVAQNAVVPAKRQKA